MLIKKLDNLSNNDLCISNIDRKAFSRVVSVSSSTSIADEYDDEELDVLVNFDGLSLDEANKLNLSKLTEFSIKFYTYDETDYNEHIKLGHRVSRILEIVTISKHPEPDNKYTLTLSDEFLIDNNTESKFKIPYLNVSISNIDIENFNYELGTKVFFVIV